MTRSKLHVRSGPQPISDLSHLINLTSIHYFPVRKIITGPRKVTFRCCSATEVQIIHSSCTHQKRSVHLRGHSSRQSVLGAGGGVLSFKTAPVASHTFDNKQQAIATQSEEDVNVPDRNRVRTLFLLNEDWALPRYLHTCIES